MQYVSEKVEVQLLYLTRVGDKEPQAVYTALTRSFQHKRTFLHHIAGPYARGGLIEPPIFVVSN